MIASSVYMESGRLAMAFPFSRVFVDLLKDSIPPGSRQWNPIDKVWTVDGVYADLAITLLRRHFPDAHIGERPHSSSSRPPRSTCACMSGHSDYAKLYVLPTAPPEVVRAAYRALTKTAHPDLGGDIVAMQELNAAFERVGKGSR